jgi:hypothetical protein
MKLIPSLKKLKVLLKSSSGNEMSNINGCASLEEIKNEYIKKYTTINKNLILFNGIDKILKTCSSIRIKGV